MRSCEVAIIWPEYIAFSFSPFGVAPLIFACNSQVAVTLGESAFPTPNLQGAAGLNMRNAGVLRNALVIFAATKIHRFASSVVGTNKKYPPKWWWWNMVIYLKQTQGLWQFSNPIFLRVGRSVRHLVNFVCLNGLPSRTPPTHNSQWLILVPLMNGSYIIPQLARTISGI